MKTEQIEKVLSEIDESTIDRALQERYAKTEKRSRASNESKPTAFSKRMIVIAAAAALLICGLALVIPLSLRNTDPPDIPSDPEIASSQPAEENTSKPLTEKVVARYLKLSASDRSKIESEINKKEEHEFTFSYFDGPDGYDPDFSSTCYGKFGDCSVWFLAGQACVIDVKEVGGYKFIFSSSFSIRVEKDGEIYDLKDAFENGLLTADDIEEIYEIHKDFVAEYYNGEELYKDYTKPSEPDDPGSSKEAPIDLESIDFPWFDRDAWAWTSDKERFSITNKNAEPVPNEKTEAFVCGSDTLLSDVFGAFGLPHKMYRDADRPETWILEWRTSDGGRIAVRTGGQPESYPLTFAVYGGENGRPLKLYAREQDRLAEIPNGFADLSVLSEGMSMEEVLSLLPTDSYRRDGDGEWSLLINDRDTHRFFYARFENGRLASLDDSGIDVDYEASFEEYRKVVPGMTLSEVVAILGRPLYCPTNGIDSRAFRGPDDGFWVVVFRNDAETGRKVVWDIQG